jgi:hypothetical protein
VADVTAPPEGRGSVLVEELRRRLETNALGIGSTVSSGGTRYRVVGFDPVGVHNRLVYVEDVTSRLRYSIAVQTTPE